MAKFKSNYPELGFYCCGEFRQFSNGEYSTEASEEIAVLESIADAVRVDKPEEPAPAKPKAPAKNKK